jgi:outer membrane scaffolding protein for murein synthesis (MipA/OmpV family)
MRRALWWLVAGLAVAPSVQAQEEPLWELGMGGAVMSLPDYRGADEGKTYVLPIPYIAYNGEVFHIDRRGVHGDLAHKDNVWLDVSMNLGPPADSTENNTRRGMPDLDSTIEFGPSLKVLLLANEQRDRTWTLYLPLRAVIATDFKHTHSIGVVFAPHITYDYLNFGPGGGWNFSASVGPIYASEKYHDYYYQVDPQFVTATRPAYEADGGYSGMRLTLTESKRFKDYWVGAFVRYDRLEHATFEDSPLVRRKSSFVAGIGASWIFARSAETVPVRRASAD